MTRKQHRPRSRPKSASKRTARRKRQRAARAARMVDPCVASSLDFPNDSHKVPVDP